MNGISRRKVLAAGSIGAMGLLVPPALKLLNHKTKTLGIVTPYGTTNPLYRSLISNFKFQVNFLSAGLLKVEFLSEKNSGDIHEYVQMIHTGQADAIFGNSALWETALPGSPFYSWVPFGLHASRFDQWLKKEGQPLWEKLYSELGLRPLAFGRSGPIAYNWARFAFATQEDLQGARVFGRGIYTQTLELLGAKRAILKTAPAGGITLFGNWRARGLVRDNPLLADALHTYESGGLEILDWVSPQVDIPLGLSALSSHHVSLSHAPKAEWPFIGYELLFNEKFWQNLNDVEKQIISIAAESATHLMSKNWQQRDQAALTKMEILSSVKSSVVQPELTAKLYEQSRNVLWEHSSQSKIGRRIFDSYTAFQDQCDS